MPSCFRLPSCLRNVEMSKDDKEGKLGKEGPGNTSWTSSNKTETLAVVVF